jgi:hypothetical protein
VSRTGPNSLFTLVPGAVLLTGADRNGVIVAVAMAEPRKIPKNQYLLVVFKTFNSSVLSGDAAALLRQRKSAQTIGAL